ncbi:MAG: phytanoyl-CoA dioxygenase family protein, partial [Alphaproteobacteria bacterium]
MQLSESQLEEFDREGYLFLPGCFTEAEAAVLRREAEGIYAQNREEVWREKTGAPRTAFAAHTYNDAYRRLGAHPRLIGPVTQLLGEPVYMHQFKINAKAAFEGDVWQWHQDYGTWARDDGMPESRAMNIAVFLDEVMAINGPLMFIPRSHKQGVLQAGHDLETTSYPLWTLDRETVTRLADDGGIVAPTGPA